MRRSARRSAKEEEPLTPVEEEVVIDEGIMSQEEEDYEDEEDVDEEDDDEEGVTFEEEEDETEEGLEANWEGECQDHDEDEEEEEEQDMAETGSMSPTDALLGDGEVDDSLVKVGTAPGSDPICYHCGVPLVEPPLRIGGALSDLTSPKISIPLHCEVCVRGIHSQCHISLGGSLPTQEESFVCFHCRTSNHGKYEMKAADRVKIPVGPAHQVPILPAMFFACPTEVPLSVARDRFVQVWSADAAKTVIKNDKEVHEYLQKACANWPDRLRVNSSGGSLAPGSVRKLYLPRAAAYTSASSQVLNHYWCPFSPEFSLTILHRCNYDAAKAIEVIKNPKLRDCFSSTCFPPTKPYCNKWKPKDRRWRMLKVPFPTARSEAPAMADMYGGGAESGDGPRLRSRRYLNYNY